MDGRGSNGGDKGLIWQLPELHIENFGKVGPAFGAGVGCGLGLGLGLVGGVGIGPGLPGLQLGMGLGAGCGIGMGFGYGVGIGEAHDANWKYSNTKTLFKNDINALVDELILNTRKVVRATSREFDKWRK